MPVPKYIPNRHVKRMFPYAFFNELYEVLDEYTPDNPVFLFRDTPLEERLDKDLEKQFDEIRHEFIKNKTLEENNIYTLDQGEFLILDTMVKRKDRQGAIDKKPVAKYVLLAQYFDSVDKPVFSKDVKNTTIRLIPEILWDDPRLALAILCVIPEDLNKTDGSSEIGIIKCPDCFTQKFIENIETEVTTDGK